MLTRKRCVAAGALISLTICATAAGQQQEYGENIVLENLSSSIRHDGRAVRRHMRTRNSYSVIGWTHEGDGLLFSYRGGLYKSKGPRSKFTPVAEYHDTEIGNAQKAIVCGAKGYVFLDDEDGDEYRSVYVTDGRSFRPTKISTGRTRNLTPVVSDSMDLIAYAGAEENTGIWQLFLQAPCTADKRVVLYSGIAPNYPKDIHPNNKYLLAGSPEDDGYKLWEFDTETNDGEIILSTSADIEDAYYSADGRYIFYTSNAESEFIELHRFDRETRDVIRVVADIGLDIENTTISGDRTKLAVSVNRAGLSNILVIDIATLSLIAGPSKQWLGVVSRMRFSPDGSQLAVRLSQPTTPRRSGLYDYLNEEFTPWTGGFDPGQKIIDLLPQVTTYPTFDRVGEKQRRIPVLVYRPSTASDAAAAPVVIFVHGGPESQARPNFNHFYHYIVTKMGIAVVRPNIRGSTGYGKSFELLDETTARWDAVKDIGALLDWIEAQPDLDSSRVAIAGGSYGGFVSLASLTEYPDRFRGGISVVGISDFVTFLHNTEPYRLENRRREYGDERDPEIVSFLNRISPLRNAGKIASPVLIIQGGNDPRVPQQQAEDMIAAIRSNDGPRVSYLLAKNEGHGFTQSENRMMADGARIAFLREILLSD